MRIKADGYEITNEGDTGPIRVGAGVFRNVDQYNIFYNGEDD